MNKKIFSTFLLVSIIFCSVFTMNLSVDAREVCLNELGSNSDYEYSINNNEVCIKKYIGTEKDVIIPSYIDGNVVRIIDTSAFQNNQTIISVTIPGSVRKIGDYAFEYCPRLKSVVIQEGVLEIGEEAFWDCSYLSDISIPDSVISIRSNAFSFTDYYDDEDNWNEGVLYINNHLITVKTEKTGLLNIKDGTITVAEYAVSNRKKITSVVMPDGLVNIGASAFEHCDCLYSVNIPDSVIRIGNAAFYGSYNLSKIDYSGSAESIGVSAFEYTSFYKNKNNWKDKALYIGNNLISIDASSVGEVIITEGTKCIADGAFLNCVNVTNVDLPKSLICIGNGAFEKCIQLSNINIPDNVINIGNNAFRECSQLKEISFPDNISIINQGLFFGCTKLEKVHLPQKLKAIGDNAFYSCSSISSIKIPNEVAIIGNRCFTDCRGLANIVIPEGVNDISNLFSGCKSLKSVFLPKSINRIGFSVFYKCTSLENIYYSGTEAEWKTIQIGNLNDELNSTTIHFNTQLKDYCIQSMGDHVYISDANESYLKVKATCINKNIYYMSCSVCGAIGTKTFEEGTVLEHQFEEKMYDSEKHWSKCIICGTNSKHENHISSEWIIDLLPTHENEGTKHIECTICKALLQTETIQKTTRITGDINNNEKIDINDVTLIQQFLAEMISFNDEQIVIADTNGDGKISVADVTAIQQFLAELRPSLG